MLMYLIKSSKKSMNRLSYQLSSAHKIKWQNWGWDPAARKIRIRTSSVLARPVRHSERFTGTYFKLMHNYQYYNRIFKIHWLITPIISLSYRKFQARLNHQLSLLWRKKCCNQTEIPQVLSSQVCKQTCFQHWMWCRCGTEEVASQLAGLIK